jgi:hypothetical protein
LSSGDPGVGLVRKGSGRDAVRTEEAVVEDEDFEETENAGLGNESFAKGLSRQSSLPSRRCEWTLLEPHGCDECEELTGSRESNGGNGPPGIRKGTNGSTTSSAQTYPGWYPRINVASSARISPHSFALDVITAHVEPCSTANHAR